MVHTGTHSRPTLSARGGWFRRSRLLVALVVGGPLLGSAVAAAQAKLSWNDNSGNESGFRIERSVSGGAFAPLATVSANITTYTDTTVVSGTQYAYRVCAYNAAGSSGYTNSSGYNAPLVNTAPTIGSIANQTITVNGSTSAVPFTIGDAETAAGSLTLAATSSNTTLVPNSNLLFGGSGGSRTITVTPNASQTGTATITVAVSDGLLTSKRSFTVAVNPLATVTNTAPTITWIPGQTTTVGTATAPIPFTIGDSQTAVDHLTLTGLSSNTTLVPAANIVFGGSGSNRTVTLKPAAGKSGSATITVRVSDGALTAKRAFTLTVQGNTAPTISSIPGQTTTVSTATAPIPFTIGDAQTAADRLTLAGLSSNTTLVPTANIVFGGSGTNRTVTVRPATGKSGTATITVRVGDGALTAKSAFTLTVQANTAPTITWIPGQKTTVGTATAPIPFTIGDAQTAVDRLTLTGLSSNTTLVPAANIVFGGSGANRTVTVTPASGKSGSATITVRVSDGALTAKRAFTLTVDGSTAAPSRLFRASIRARAASGDRTLTGGFRVEGSAAQPILLRALGPTLAKLGVSNVLVDPRLDLYSGQKTLLTNDDWNSGDSQLATVSQRVGAYPLPKGSRDSAMVASLGAGTYTTQVNRKDSPVGLALIEVADAGTTGARRLSAVSGQGNVGKGDNVLILEFEVAGESEADVLIRGVGPTLSTYGLTGLLPDPRVQLYRGSELLTENDNWGGGAVLSNAFSAAGAFPFASGSSKDAALVATLKPGVYRVVLSGTNLTTGIGMVEVYTLTK